MLSRLCFTLFALFISALLAGCNNTTDTTSPAGHNNVSQNTSTNVPQYSAEQFFCY